MDPATPELGGAPTFEVEVAHADGEPEALVRVAGEIDIVTVGELGRALEQVIADGATRVRLDLARVPFVDSTGLTALLTARAQLDGRGTVVVEALSPVVRRTLEVAGLDRVFGTA